MGKESQEITADFARLGVRIELSDKKPLNSDQFERFVSEAIREVFGTCGPIVKVAEFSEDHQRGSIVAPGDEIQSVWAAVSTKGVYNGRRIAAHLHSLTETEASNIF